MSSGNEFHSTGPAQEKDRGPYIVPGYGEAHTTERYQLILGLDVVRMA